MEQKYELVFRGLQHVHTDSTRICSQQHPTSVQQSIRVVGHLMLP